MTDLPVFSADEFNADAVASIEGYIALFVPEGGKLDNPARRVNRLMKGALERFVESEDFTKLNPGEGRTLTYPTGLAAKGVIVVRLDRKASAAAARGAGATIAGRSDESVTIMAGTRRDVGEIALGLGLRAYSFRDHRTDEPSIPPLTEAVFLSSKPEDVTPELARARHRIEGVYFTRDLVNEPSNVLTTTEFADRLVALEALGVDVTVLEEPELEELGMRTLLAVGQGSESPSKVVIMEWKGGGDEAPFALVGKGVVFDTGGISLKPAGGMEEMTMDMGGAGTVAGVMKAIALRQASANVIGLVGLVENMPDGRAQRPGDVVRTMKGDTVEVINTDAEGRLVLCDVLWHVQEAYKPRAIVDLATLTGAIVIALGHHNAGVFANDDDFANDFLRAANAEGEGAWRMPLGSPYDKQLESRVADMKNIGGRPAGSVTAAKFLERFIQPDMPWIHLDIAGVASRSAGTRFSPKGATGWGVLALDRLIRDRYEV